MGKVIVKDANGNILKEYSSKNQCKKETEIDINKINKCFINNEPINGLYYCLEEMPKNYSQLKCNYCGKIFYRNNTLIKEANNIYCSNECRVKASKEKVENNCVCPICGKTFHRDNWAIENNINNYCSNNCKNIALSFYKTGKPNSWQFQIEFNESSGEYYNNGHRYVIINYNHPSSIMTEFGMAIKEEIIIAENYLLNDLNTMVLGENKYLSNQYTIAHKNFVLDDNDINNLYVITIDEYNSKLLEMTSNYFVFKKYCEDNLLDYKTTYTRFLYNKDKYNRNSNGIGWW